MSAPPWMLLRLALETARHHTHADEDRLRALSIRTAADYRAFLLRAYGFEVPVEAAIGRVLELDRAVLRERSKAERLTHDLGSLGVDARECPLAGGVVLRSVPQALGWLFVIERHTLLAGLIRRHVLRALGDEVGNAVSYLSVYGQAPGARFRELGEHLGAYAEHYTPAAIIAAAGEAFRAQRQWHLGCVEPRVTSAVRSAV